MTPNVITSRPLENGQRRQSHDQGSRLEDTNGLLVTSSEEQTDLGRLYRDSRCLGGGAGTYLREDEKVGNIESEPWVRALISV